MKTNIISDGEKAILELLLEADKMVDAATSIKETEGFEYARNMSNQSNKSNLIFQLLVDLYDDKEKLEKSLHEWLYVVDDGLFDKLKEISKEVK